QESPARLISVQNQAIPDASDVAFAAIRFFFEHEAALKALEEAGLEEVENKIKNNGNKKDENKNKLEKNAQEEKKVKFTNDEKTANDEN
ncbi:hypothetical protein ACLIMM_13890, partial [Enterococcus faecium]|uniref:hypothetical protein n=1 Tax=Enterococcus faecium TaxID=1352 RepID=UPI003CEB8F10